MVPTDEPQAGGSDMDFLASLSLPSSPGRCDDGYAGRSRTAGGDRTASRGQGTGRFHVLRPASRARQKNDQMMLIYIGGGVVGGIVILVIGLVAMAAFFGGGDSNSGGTTKDQNMRFNLTETQRKRLFKDLLHAADENGPNRTCREPVASVRQPTEPRRPADFGGFKEGMTMAGSNRRSRQPSTRSRRPIIRHGCSIWNQTNRDPIMSQ